MSTASRIALRERYMQGWFDMDAALLLATTAPAFIFDDPVEPEVVTRAMLTGYMQRWRARMQAAGGDNDWRLTHESRSDQDGILIDWEWWEVIGTGLQGAAVILTGNDGVLLERITYFDRDLHNAPVLR
jgi:hypothetical protein